ncbi:hypothetical protein GUJ93_ZPchr0001g30149 [Zizania palustris]|uniref:Uncharacterized protein n=1 Tax=Zizania palustris TaxID=103762 RepID=A0A8J5S813_ZIZPA|nr:hypothetical protein GUJ93_ZPchr0001g30149 [Zizania palustris]
MDRVEAWGWSGGHDVGAPAGRHRLRASGSVSRGSPVGLGGGGEKVSGKLAGSYGYGGVDTIRIYTAFGAGRGGRGDRRARHPERRPERWAGRPKRRARRPERRRSGGPSGGGPSVEKVAEGGRPERRSEWRPERRRCGGAPSVEKIAEEKVAQEIKKDGEKDLSAWSPPRIAIQVGWLHLASGETDLAIQIAWPLG